MGWKTPNSSGKDFTVVLENMTIQETSTTVSQQIDLTPFQITGINPQKTVQPSTVSPESMRVSTINHEAISYSNTIPSPLVTVSASKDLKPSMAQTATFSADVFFTSTSIPLSTQSTPIHTATGSMKVTQHSHLGKTKTTKMLEVMGTETFHPTTAIDFFDTSGITKNSIVSETLTTKSQSAVGNTTSFLMTESTSMSTTSWPKHKSTDVATLPTSKSGHEFLVSSAARTASWSTLEETSAITTDIGIASTFPEECFFTPTAAPMNSVFPGSQVASTLSTTDTEMAFTVHSVLPMSTTSALKTVKTESVSTNSQHVFSPSMEDALYTPLPIETSPMVFSSITSSPVTGTRGDQTVIHTKSTHLALTSTTNEPMLSLISTKSLFTHNVSEPGLISVTDKIDYQFFTNETTWTSKPNQTLLTSMNTNTIPTFMPNENITSPFQDSTTNIDNSSLTTNITLLEASTDSEGTTSSDAATALLKSTSRWLSNFSNVSGITSITSQPESKHITLLLKNNSVPTVAANELPSISRETVVPLVNVSTLADIKPFFSTEKSISETTQIDTNGMSTFGVTMAPLPISATTQRVYTTVTEETTSHHPKVKSTIAAVAEVSPFSAILEATGESAQMVTASVTVSPFQDMEKLTTTLDNETATTGVGVSWLLTELMKSTPKSSYDGTTETFDLNHTYTVHWTSETSAGNLASSSISVSNQTLPKLLDSSTRIMGATFSTTFPQKTAVSLSACNLSPQTTDTYSSATPHPPTHMFSLPVNVSAVTSPATMVAVFDETKVTLSQPSTFIRDFTTSMLSPLPTVTMTTAVMPPGSSASSTTSDIMPTHRDSLYTTSEVTELSSMTAHMAVSSLRETLVPSLRPPTPVITKAISTLPSVSADLVNPSTHTLVCSKPPPSNITLMTSTYVSSTTSTSFVSQVEDSTYVFSFPYTFSSTGDVDMASGPTDISTGGETMSPPTSVNKLTTSVDTKSTTYFVNTSVSTQLAVATSMLSSEKEQTNTSMGKTPRTTRVAEISPSKNSFILDSQSTFPWEMTDTEFSETTEISSHQTHLPSEILPGNPTSGNLATSTSGNAQTTETLTSSTIIGVHVSEGSTNLGETALPSQPQTITKSLSPGKERTSTLSEYPSRTLEKTVSSSSLTHPDTGHQTTSSVDTTTFRIVSFYNTKMSFSIFDEEPRVLITTVIHEFTKDWLNFMFQNSEFSLANLAIQIKSSCACSVIIKANSSLESAELISRIRTNIYGNLTHANFTQDQLTLLVKSDHVVVEKLDSWTLVQLPVLDLRINLYPSLDKGLMTTGIHSISIQTGKCQWEKPSFKQCKLLHDLPDKIMDLANITISDENADDVAEHILNLLNESPPLNEEETKIIVSKVDAISNCGEISTNLTQIILQIISTVTEKQSNSASNLPPVSNKVQRRKLGVLLCHLLWDSLSVCCEYVLLLLVNKEAVLTDGNMRYSQNYDQVYCAFWDFDTNSLCKGVESPGTGVIDSCELPCGCWELNPGCLKEQPVLLAIEPSLQPLKGS
ncbi:hypothetical protein STEG23_015188 [Scotinomys teguina]